MDISKIKNVIEKIFSEDGFSFLNLSFVCPKNIHIVLKKESKNLSMDFIQEMPYVRIKKIILPITVYVEGISLGEDKGSIKLKYFPDIHFQYGDNNDLNFSDNSYQEPVNSDSELIMYHDEIREKYPDDERRQIAKLALEYTYQWCVIFKNTFIPTMENGIVDIESLKKQCKNFVIENIKQSKKIKSRSSILSFVLLYFVIPYVVNWVIKRFLDRLLK